MRGKTVLVLLLVVVALISFIALFERDLPSTDEREVRDRRLIGVDADEVVALSLEGPTGTVSLRRAVAEEAGDGAAAGSAVGDGWRLVEPLAAPADGGEVDRLLAAVVALEKERTLEEADRAGLGLEAPQARIVLETAADSWTLELGARVPGSSWVVAAISGDPRLHVVSGGILADLEREPGQWRSREVYRGERDRIERIVLAGEEQIVLERRDGRFWMTSPLEDLAEREAVDELLRQLEELQVASFVDGPITVGAGSGHDADSMPSESGEPTGLDAPQRVLRIFERDVGEPLELAIGDLIAAADADGSAEGELGERRYARVDGQTIEIESQLFSTLERPSSDWLSRAWSGLRVFQIDRLRIEGDGGPLELSRSGSDWLRDGDRIEAVAVSDLLYAITGARALQVVGGDAAGALVEGLEPTLSIDLGSDDFGEETLTLYSGDGSGHPAQTTVRESVLLLPPEVVRELSERLRAVRTLDPLPGE